MANDFELLSDIVTVEDLLRLHSEVSHDLLLELVRSQSLPAYSRGKKVYGPKGTPLFECEPNGFPTTPSMGGKRMFISWENIVFKAQDVQALKTRQWKVALPKPASPETSRVRVLRINSTRGDLQPMSPVSDVSQYERVVSSKFESIPRDELRDGKRAVEVPAFLFAGKTPQKVRDNLREKGFADCVIAYVLFAFLKEKKTAIGRLLVRTRSDSLEADQKKCARLVDTLLEQANGLSIYEV